MVSRRRIRYPSANIDDSDIYFPQWNLLRCLFFLHVLLACQSKKRKRQKRSGEDGGGASGGEGGEGGEDGKVAVCNNGDPTRDPASTSSSSSGSSDNEAGDGGGGGGGGVSPNPRTEKTDE